MPIRRLALLAPHCLALLWLLCAGAAVAQNGDALPPTVAAALKAAGIPPGAVAIHVQELGADTPRLAVNAAQPMNPASVMKLVTTFVALEMLGPAYTWKTEVLIDAPVADGVLAGDLYLKGGGDPKLTFEQFWLLLRQVRAHGIRDVAGDLVLDRSAFEPRADAADFDDQPLRAYNVGPDALLVGFKTVRLNLAPDAAAKAVRVVAEPQPANLEVVNLVRLSSNGCGNWKDALRADVSEREGRYRLVLTGSYALSCGQRNWHLAVMPHERYTLGVFQQLWQELGGGFKGAVRAGAVPAGARLAASIESPTLAEIVRDINKFSNNVMARQLYLTLGMAAGKRPARSEDAEAALRAWLDGRGLALPDLVIDNGSGLSRRERLSAASLGRLLAAAWKSSLMPEFVASLPLAAVDGTMKKRLTGNGLSGQAHVKTGTLEGVKTIAGYVPDRRGRQHAVVFFINHANAQLGQEAQDALLEWVYDGGDDKAPRQVAHKRQIQAQ